MSIPNDYTQIGKDRFVERKDVTDNDTGTYFIYQRSCATTHYAKTDVADSCPSAASLDAGLPPAGSPNVGAGVERTVRSSVRWNPITGKVYYGIDSIAYSSWWKIGPKEPATPP